MLYNGFMRIEFEWKDSHSKQEILSAKQAFAAGVLDGYRSKVGDLDLELVRKCILKPKIK